MTDIRLRKNVNRLMTRYAKHQHWRCHASSNPDSLSLNENGLLISDFPFVAILFCSKYLLFADIQTTTKLW